ncbi:MAG: ATP-binding protein [Burkholderiales bacterium]|nr:ATP-binding protein [Burkholderiales bacterium]
MKVSAIFPARLEALASVCGLLERFCADGGVPRDDCLRLNLVLEEFFTNTVRHGHGRDCDAPVWIALDASPGSLCLEIEDTAPPYNPFAGSVDLDAPIEERRIGGLGVHLARELSVHAEYAYVFGRNCIRLQLARSG